MTTLPKSKIFISHANPDDNYFALWLSNKLNLIGYQTWVDIDKIKPGGYFNQMYESALREESIIFVPILTANYIFKANKPDTGVANEISLARIIGKQIDSHNFIVPILLDQNISYNDFPVGIVDRDTINFSKNWGEGLSKLTNHLKELKVELISTSNNILSSWYEFLNVEAKPIIRQEKYFANWLPVLLPVSIFVLKCEHSIIPVNFPYPFITESYYVISFFSSDVLESYNIPVLKKWTFRTDDFKNQQVDLHEFVIQDARKKLVKLLNLSILKYIPIAKAWKYDMANERYCYYFPSGGENNKQISLEHIGKNRRTIIGRNKEHNWHFGLSFDAILHPLAAYRVNYHVLFSDKRNEKLVDKTTMQKLRKSSTTDWYNEKWYETMIAFLHRFSNFATNYKIAVPCNEDNFIIIDTIPMNFETVTGYNEPSDKNE